MLSTVTYNHSTNCYRRIPNLNFDVIEVHTTVCISDDQELTCSNNFNVSKTFRLQGLSVTELILVV